MDNSYLKEMLQRVLQRAHRDPRKQGIDEYSNRLQFACPYCGDSRKDPHKKRAALYTDTLSFKCFNEDCRSNALKLFSDFGEDLGVEARMEVVNRWSARKVQSNVDLELIAGYLDHLIKLEDFRAWSNREGSDFVTWPISPGSGTHKYLTERMVEPTKNMLAGKFYGRHVVVVMNMIGDMVLSMQVRSLSNKNRLYKFFNYSTLKRAFTNEPPSPDLMQLYDRYGGLFNLFRVNFSRVVTVCEGYFDSTFFANSVATVGLNADVGLILGSGLETRWVYDNDPKPPPGSRFKESIGIRKARVMILAGHSVFLWRRFLADQRLPHTVKDINQAVTMKPECQQHLGRYFSSDVGDLIDL